MNLHARIMKFLSKLACLFGCSHVPYSTFYIVPTVVARQHNKKTGQTCVDGSL